MICVCCKRFWRSEYVEFLLSDCSTFMLLDMKQDTYYYPKPVCEKLTARHHCVLQRPKIQLTR